MREINVGKMISIFAITTLIFLAEFLFAGYLTDAKLSGLEQTVSDISLQTASVETEYNLLLANPCSYAGFSTLTASLDLLANKLVFNTAQQQQNQNRIESIKQNYFLLETRHWLFVQKLNSECKTNFIPVLFFYSDKGDCEVCKAQGIVLSAIKESHPEVMIYSFDTNTDYSLVNTLKEIYGVKSAPSLVIDGKLYSEFLNQDDLGKILERQEMNNTGSQNNSKSQ
jgi:hypothetical protein